MASLTRNPYVGEGAEGACRSAQINPEEADTLPPGNDRDSCLLSAEGWHRRPNRSNQPGPTSDPRVAGAARMWVLSRGWWRRAGTSRLTGHGGGGTEALGVDQRSVSISARGRRATRPRV
jgi:hypothetical protein